MRAVGREHDAASGTSGPTSVARLNQGGCQCGSVSQLPPDPQGALHVGAPLTPLPPHPQGLPQVYGPATATRHQPATQNGGASTTSVAAGAQPQPTPQQWLGQAHPQPGVGDPLSLVVGGINQLQQARMKQLDEGEVSPEAVKSGMSVLPVLKAVNPQTAPIDIQDWIEMLNAPMADLSNSSATWWTRVRELAMETYKEWARSTP